MSRNQNLVAFAFIALLPAVAWAQPGDQMPQPVYYAAVDELYRGEYRDAERAFQRLGRSGVQAAQTRWIDSICYHAMLGEVYFHQGRNGEALAEFDQACLLLLANPDFMRKVKFEDPRQELAAGRQPPPWGVGGRQFVLGRFPNTMPVLMGELSAERAIREGGAFLQAQYWRVNVAEILRTSALAIRRRNEILGPLGKYDRISKELAAKMSGGRLAPPNHWSQAWVELLAGVAQAGVGSNDEAKNRLQRAITLGGQFDHPLTGVALLELGRLALVGGDHRAAGQWLYDASVSGFFYDDLDVVTESLRLAWLNQLASGQAGTTAVFDAAAAWAQANRYWHIVAAVRLPQGQFLAQHGQLADAAAIFAELNRRIGSMRLGRPGIELMYLEALIDLKQDRYEAGSKSLRQALAAQAGASLRNFQIARVGMLYDAGDISARVAPEVYAPMLADPLPVDWAQRTLDTLAVLQTPHDDAFTRWFAAALERKDAALALEVSERAKRARFLSSLPLGGRLLALRAVLEAPASELGNAERLERQQLLAAFPDYRELSETAASLEQQLRGGPVVPKDAATGQAINDMLSALKDNTDTRERMLVDMALSPVPSTFVFPPLRSVEQLQSGLEPGAALLVFHAAGGKLFGFVVSGHNLHAWVLGDARVAERAVAEFLRALGNYGSKREMATAELAAGDWRAASADILAKLFAESRFDVANTKRLAIVPDGCLWYLPFEALAMPGANPPAVLLDRMQVHYGPTAGLTVGDARPFRRLQHTGIVANRLGSEAASAGKDAAVAPIEEVVVGPVRLVPPLAAPGYLFASLLDGLVVLDEVELDRNDAYGWSPLPKSRGRNADSLSLWMGLPYDGPERVVLVGFPTAAESGLRGSRRGEAAPPGTDVFQAVCGLMASGARTVLLSRWRTGGQMNLQLVREFVQELPHGSAADAWQRSVMIAQETPLDPSQEPRLKKLDEGVEPPGAEHPFFWAGYLLVDTGTGVADATAAEANDVGESVDATDAGAENNTGQGSPAVPPQGDFQESRPADSSTRASDH